MAQVTPERIASRNASGGHRPLDLSLVALPVSDEHLPAEPLFSEPPLLAVPPRHGLAKRRRITIADLARERFILLSEMHCTASASRC
jgi:DNA-binding transcriptional LysR family regulator